MSQGADPGAPLLMQRADSASSSMSLPSVPTVRVRSQDWTGPRKVATAFAWAFQ